MDGKLLIFVISLAGLVAFEALRVNAARRRAKRDDRRAERRNGVKAVMLRLYEKEKRDA